MLPELVRKNRSYRRFDQNTPISGDTLVSFIQNARLSPSAANLQPLRYIICNERLANEKIFACTRWAGYLRAWDGPEQGERPSAYIIVLGKTEHSKYHHYDAGIAAQTIMLSAAEKGFGGCILAAVDRDRMRKSLSIDSSFEILLVLALGKPAEKIEIDEVCEDESIEYWRDDHGTHHVPKRKSEDLIVDRYIGNQD
jgi:nitroreductase